MSRSVQHHTYGGPEILEVVEVVEPEAGPGEVKVRITAASLNPVDWKIFTGPAAEAFGLRLPSGVGNDLAGIVEAVGEGVTEFAPGDRVFGGHRFHALADYAAVPATRLWHTPDEVDDVTAATLDIAARTAVAAVDAAELGPGDTVLIGGAAGGVGVFAVQYAAGLGATVLGTASPANHAALRELGVAPVAYGDGLLDRVREQAPDGLAAVVDLHGADALEVGKTIGVPPGRLISITHAAGAYGGRDTGGADARPDAIDDIVGRIAEKRLTVPIAATFSLEETRAAYELLIGGHLFGKIVVLP